MPRSSGSSASRETAEDCLPRDALNQLRARVVGKTLCDDVAEVTSAALAVGEKIRSRNLYIESALERLQFVISCAEAPKPSLILARDELLRIQFEIYQKSGYISGWLARVSRGSSTVLVLAALATSLVLWSTGVIVIWLLVNERVFPALQNAGVSLFAQNVFFMDPQAFVVIASAAFIGGVLSIATRLGEFAKIRGLDPFAMFWTAFLKPLIGVVLSVFILAALAGQIVGFGFLASDPLGLSVGDQQILFGGATSTGTFSLKTAYILWVIGFLAGFSERFASDFVQRTEGIASGNVGGDKKN
jgi:hypothetical protein